MNCNPYIIILALSTLAGVATAGAGWLRLVKAKRRSTWPVAEGVVTRFVSSKESPDMCATLDIEYVVAKQTYRKTLPVDERGATKTGVGQPVSLRYEPSNPDNIELVAQATKSEWLVIATGIGATAFGIFAILSNI